MDGKGRRGGSPKPRSTTISHGFTSAHQRTGTNTAQSQSTVAPSPGSLNILSSILRAPYPSIQKGIVKEGQTSQGTSQAQLFVSRGKSPIKVITATGDTVAGKPALSPSRVPTTLPPKKSLSPSRTIFAERVSPPPPRHVSTPNRNISPGSAVGQSSSAGSGRSAQLLSHLPYLSQTLQQQGGEGLFQQYKTLTQASMDRQGQTVVVSAPRSENKDTHGHPGRTQGRVSPSGPQMQQPRPAHQGSPSPVHISTIRRTPSPAHIQGEAKAKVIVEHSSLKTEAVNLIKATQANKTNLQSQWSEDFRYGDLLQSINRQQETVIHPHLQQGLSPITPADPAETRPWPATSNIHLLSSQIARPLVSSMVATGGQGHGYIVASAASAQEGATGGGFVPVPSSASAQVSLSSMSSIGFTPVVLPSHVQKTLSPKSQTQRQSSPKGYNTSPSSNSYVTSFSSPSKQTTISYVQASSGKSVEETVRVYPRKDSARYTVPSVLPTVTQSGPPNVTISSCSNIFPPQERTISSQKMQRNPFTFPATPPASLLAGEKPPFSVTVGTSQSKFVEQERRANQKERHSSGEMPCLDPVSPVFREKKPVIKEENGSDLVEIPQPYNMRLQTLANFPNNSTYRPSYRAISVAIHKAKVGCITNPAKSLDILRQNLQKSINKEIGAVIQTYMDKFFKLGIENIKLNNGENSVTDDHVQTMCRQILEEAKKMYMPDLGRVSVSPARDLSDNVSDAGSSGRRSALGRRRHPSDTDSEAGLRPAPKKKKGPFKGSSTGRSTPSKLLVSKREGPKFDPERLTEETEFVMGSRANKAMGFGATRGRLYMKHPDLFKYSGDQDDKTWLYEHQHMPATGGKSYIIILEDIKDLLTTDEYKDAPGINTDILVGFTVPMWMIEKMRVQMIAMRTDLPKQAKYRSRSATPNEVTSLPDLETVESPPKDLPFANFRSPTKAENPLEASPADELEFLQTGGSTDPSSRLSPFNMTGGFDDATSQSDLDTLDDETSIEPSFPIQK